jgi:hypothetical protein
MVVYGGVWWCVYGGCMVCVYGGVWWCVCMVVCVWCMVVYGGVCMVVCDRQYRSRTEREPPPAARRLSGSALIPCIRVWCVVRVIP